MLSGCAAAIQVISMGSMRKAERGWERSSISIVTSSPTAGICSCWTYLRAVATISLRLGPAAEMITCLDELIISMLTVMARHTSQPLPPHSQDCHTRGLLSKPASYLSAVGVDACAVTIFAAPDEREIHAVKYMRRWLVRAGGTKVVTECGWAGKGRGGEECLARRKASGRRGERR
eukprot:764927-Hanusia_phi.AAC.3